MSENIALSASAPRDKADQQARMEDRFGPFIHALQNNVDTLTGVYQHNNVAVVGKAEGLEGDELFELYLNSFEDEAVRQDHNCRCCKHFLRSWGSLVQVGKDGVSHSLLFQDSEDIPELYRGFVQKAAALLAGRKLQGPLTASPREKVLTIGVDKSGGFEHFHFAIKHLPLRDSLRNQNQGDAELREDVRLFTLAQGAWKAETLTRATQLFTYDQRLARSSFRPVVEGFVEIREYAASIKDHRARHNYLTSQIVGARKGLARINQSVVGVLLEELENFKDENFAIQRFLANTGGENYMRPTEAPTAGALARAEKIFAELDLAPALKRRSMRRDEVPRFVWQPKATAKAEEAPAGVFGHLKTRDDAPTTPTASADIQAGKISVLGLYALLDAGDVEKLELMVPGGHTQVFSSLTVATNPDARPILQWDDEENRNTACSYNYTQPVHASTWNLNPYTWEEIIGAVPEHHLFSWQGDYTAKQLEKRWFLMARGYDTHSVVRLPLFPQTLRQELHEVRAVIEAYASSAQLEEVDQGLVVANPMIGLKFRLTTNGTRVVYEIGSMN